MAFDFGKITNVMVEGIDHRDCPDYCDAFIASADYDGVEMNEELLDELNDCGDFVHESVYSQIY